MGDGVITVVAAVAVPLVIAVLWGAFAAPKARRRLTLRPRIVFELGVFGLAAVGLLAAGDLIVAVAFAIATVVNAALLTYWEQWES